MKRAKTKPPVTKIKSRNDEMNEIFKKYKLNNSHVFKGDGFTKLTRHAIQKIQAQEGIQITYELAYCSSSEAAIKASGYFEGKKYETFGEASPSNNRFKFPVAMAQKRAQERLVLDMILLEHSDVVMGESEIDSQPIVKISGQSNAADPNESVLSELKKIKR